MSKPVKPNKPNSTVQPYSVKSITSNTLHNTDSDQELIYQENSDNDQTNSISTIISTNKTETDLTNMSQTETVKITNIDTPKLTSQNSQEWVSLNVGGTVITTTKTTLLKYSDLNDHFLAKLISDNDLPSTVDDKGAFLIDRNPEYFKHVINFLRNGRLDIPAECTLEGILSEAEFCNLRELENLCRIRIVERDVELERQKCLDQKSQKRVIYRVLQSSATELTQMISTLSESWRLEQILSLNLDAAATHTNQMNGGGGNEYLVVVSQTQVDNSMSNKLHSNDETFSNCNDKVKALSGSLSAHTITTLYR